MYSPCIAEYNNEDIPQIHLTADGIHQQKNIKNVRLVCQIILPVTVARGPVFISAVISYSLTYDAVDVTDDDNLATALSAQFQINIMLVSMVQKPLVPTVLAKQWV